MKLANAIKKLATVGEVTQSGAKYSATSGNYVVSFYANRDNTAATGFKVTHIKAMDDHSSDYFAGTYCQNLTQAIKLAATI